MANLKDIRTRISSVKNTQQITRAMKMVSAAKLRKAQNNVIQCRPYSYKIKQVIGRILRGQDIKHPFITQDEAISEEIEGKVNKTLYVVLTSDRGLCGGFNNNIVKKVKAELSIDDNNKLGLFIIGKKAADSLKYVGYKPLHVQENIAREMSYGKANEIAEHILKIRKENEFDNIKVIYNKFVSAIQQDPVEEQLLPINSEFFEEQNSEKNESYLEEFIYEPSLEIILDDFLKQFFSTQVYKALCESLASEHAARMSSMESATSNASDMIQNLTLTYNKLRQASITTELIEITSGAEALNG